MAIYGLDHINISTVKLAETQAFFMDVLGLTPGWRPNLPFDGVWLYAGDKALVHVAVVPKEPAASRTAALDHFAFAVSDYDGTKAMLEAKGIAYRTLDVPGADFRQLFLADPNGATLELNFREPAISPG